jgi:hypothetical protein
MNRRSFEVKPTILDKEFEIDIEDDYDYYHSENIDDENLHIGASINNELHPKDSYLYSSQCDNENCINIANEINKLCDECLNLEHKCILIDHVQSKSLLEMTEKITEMNQKLVQMIDTVENYEGDGLDGCSYPKLMKIENSLMKLLTKVKVRISQLEYDIIIGKKEDYLEPTLCNQCKKSCVNCVLRPCNHVCLCIECVKNLLKCPMCNKIIEYFDKVYLPNN